ncbi:hypothetical protein B0T20DRAFT_479346 [Sordaria brevicollis]|uniref:Uncharacterized protein n=1 Tax=Sordaria brevicollis TaxID=83679 RepID=A0AAE0UCM4_SORBR|nr:hypothetical protein B0T20DRAFT_479346 [Sordaria brevicollis]
MATPLDSSVQYERDLRSSHKEWKRTKDSSSKWASGTRDLPGVKKSWSMTGELLSNQHHPNQMIKSRPARKVRDACGCEYPKQSSRNMYKLRGGNVGYHSINFPKLFAAKDIRYGDDVDYSTPSRTTTRSSPSVTTSKNLFASITSASTQAEDNFLYSFDEDSTPGFSRTALTLENFVKTDDRKTEKFVEKEYEILDANGEALKGRKAKRRGLRVPGGGASQDKGEEVEEDEGFELV